VTTPSQAPQPLSFDARPLTDPVDPKAVAAFIRQERSRGGKGSTAATVIAIVVIAFMVLGGGIVVVLGAAVAIREGSALMSLPFLGVIAIFIAIGIAASFALRRSRTTRYRLSRFAAANGMTYEDQVNDPPLPGMIFQLGRSRQAKQLVRGHTPRFVEFGNYQYTTGSGKSSTTHYWGYVAVKLDVPLPNIVLDALGNNGIRTNLPASFHRDQHLSLEGDFDSYFRLYCPAGYEQDALYLFTPDIMARFIDNAAQLDVEIVDDWLFLYTKRAATTLDASTWAWLFGAVGALITKFDQWARWRDDRLLAEHGRTFSQAVGGTAAPVPGSHALPFAPPAGMLTPPPGVAPQGRRLKRRTSWLFIVIGIVLAVLWFGGKMVEFGFSQ